MKNQVAKTNQEHLTNIAERQRKDLALYSPVNCFKHAHKLKTIKDALVLPSKKLSDFRRVYGRDWTIGYVAMWVIELNDFTNAKQKMSDAQIEFTAERIVDTFSLKITDLTLFFRNVKEGKYGQFYENLSPEKILEWLAKYFDERCEAAEMISQNEVVRLDKIHPDVAKEMFKNVGEEKVEYTHEKNSLGKRTKEIITVDLVKEIRKKTTKELKEYLIIHDSSKQTFDETIYTLIETEIDRRNKALKS